MKLLFFETKISMPLMKLPVRSTVICIDEGVLIVSPIEFTELEYQEIEAQGEVIAILAPSVLHHLFLKKTLDRYPKATLWGAPGFPAKLPHIPWNKIFTKDPWPYEKDIGLLLIDGVTRFEEVVLYCRELKTIIVGDLVFNLLHPKSIGVRLITHMTGVYNKLAVSRLVNFFMNDRGVYTRSVQNLLQWDFDQIVMSHGDILKTGGREKFRRALKEKNFL
jgi:hypothetical protein